MKKIVSVLLVLAMLLCSAAFAEVAKEDLKVGFICIGDENSGYDANFLRGASEAMETLGLSADQLIVKYNIAEDQGAYDAAVDLAENGCQYIFADSYGHGSYIQLAAAEYPEIQFTHATGDTAAASGLANLHNAFGSIFEARYVAGVVAGLKLNEMIASGAITEDAAKVGYVGAFPYAEVISGYTSFFLGMRSVCPSVTMTVKFTNSWGDFPLEKEAAEALIASGCVLISQHADTTGAPTACEAAGVPCVGYNIDMIAVAPNTALVSSRIDWAPYLTMAMQAVIDGTEIPTEWCQGFSEGAVGTTALNEAVIAEGTADKVAEVEAALADGSLQVFDTATFTVGGVTAEEYVTTDTYLNDDFSAAVHAEAAKQVVDGAFHESVFRSAPYFDLMIDGIEVLG